MTSEEAKEFMQEVADFKKYLKVPGTNNYPILTGDAKLKLDANAHVIRNIRLNLASGYDLKPDWINLDAVARWPHMTQGCDIIWDARKDKIPFADNTVEVIRTGELFLHIPKIYHKLVLADIYRVLKPGGQFIVNDVDMEWTMKKWLEDPNDKTITNLIWGGHHDDWVEYDRHCNGFTAKSLANMLTKAGFINLERINVHNPENTPYELTYKCQKP